MPDAELDVLAITGTIRSTWPRASEILTRATGPPRSLSRGMALRLRQGRDEVAVEARGCAADSTGPADFGALLHRT